MKALSSYLQPGAVVGIADRSYLNRAQATPWCRPAGEERAAALEPGAALLISVGDGRRSLWSFHRRTAATGTCMPLGEKAREALRTAERIVTHDLPVVLSAGEGRTAPWVAEHLWTVGSGLDGTVDGPSYGLSMLLAVASEALQTALPGDLAATAEIVPNGKLVAVGSLPEKIEGLLGNAPGIRRLIVSADQWKDAQAAIPSGCDLEIVAAEDVASAFDVAFANIDDEMRRRFRDRDLAVRYARQLFFLAVQGAPLLSWAGVQHAAELLLEVLPAGRAAEETRWASQVAARHCGGTKKALPWPETRALESLPLPVRQECIAHVVQSVVDGDSPDLQGTIQRARKEISPISECHDTGLRVWGAIARAEAARHRYDEALRLTSELVPAWGDIGQAHESSYALCEHVRLLGIQRRCDELEGKRLAAWVSAFDHDPRTTDVSRSFVWIAVARAWVNADRFGRARDALERMPSAMPPHVRAWRTRTEALVLDAEDRHEEADALRERLEAYHAWLARLDVALRDGGDVGPAIAALRADPPQGMERLLNADADDRSTAVRLVREYGY